MRHVIGQQAQDSVGPAIATRSYEHVDKHRLRPARCLGAVRRGGGRRIGWRRGRAARGDAAAPSRRDREATLVAPARGLKHFATTALAPPWSVDDPDPKLDRQCFIVRDANGQQLAYVYFEERRSAAKLLTSDEAARTAGRELISTQPETDRCQLHERQIV